jgi:8-oxo-dGTP pyrophosphatase MutT (NUDIX family)
VIRVLALGLFRRDGRILVAGGADPLTGSATSAPSAAGWRSGAGDEALRREIGEELGAVATDLRLVGVLENIFEYAGAMRHEVVFVFDAAFADASLYDRAELPVVESARGGTPARWMHPADFGDGRARLVPPALLDSCGRSAHPAGGAARARHLARAGRPAPPLLVAQRLHRLDA